MRILFISSGSIGDAIISTSLIAWLADTYPAARFTIAAGPAATPLFEAFPQLERLIVIRKLPHNRHWLNLWWQIFGTRWDLVVDLRGSAISFLVLTRARKIFHSPNQIKSKAEQLAALFNLPAPYPTRLWASNDAIEKANALVTAKRFILLAPKTNSAAKDWPIERFAELANRLASDDIVFVVLASEAQKESVQPLVNALPATQIIDLSGRTDLQTAYALMQRATLFIGNDSGLLHMSAASGRPGIGIYGPSNDKTYAPSGPHVKIITSHNFKPGEPEKRDISYMLKIPVQTVEAAARDLLKHPL